MAKIKKTETKWYIDCALALLILLWFYTGLSKLFRNDSFVFQMGLSPSPLVSSNKEMLGWIVPFGELALSLLLILSRYRKLALILSVLLLLVFEIYIVMMLYNGHLPCACGGVISLLSWKGHLIFNAVYIVIAITIYLTEYPRVRKRE